VMQREPPGGQPIARTDIRTRGIAVPLVNWRRPADRGDSKLRSAVLMENHKARVKRLYALAEKLGRISGQAHNLADDLTAKLVIRRAATRSTSPATTPKPSRTRKS
jgi:hypothetical protein